MPPRPAALLLGLLLHAGCGKATSASGGAASTASSASATDDRKVSLHVDSAGAIELAKVLENLADEPVRVDVSAIAALECAKLSIHEPEPIPRREALEKIAEALRTLGFRVEHSASAWLITTDPARPIECALPAVERPPPPARRPVDPATKELAGAITRASDTESVITPRGADLLRQRGADLFRPVRVVPEKDGSRILGIRVFGVRPDHPFALLGFENGDRIEHIQGGEVPIDLFAELLQALEKSPRVTVDLIRYGKPVKLAIRVE